MPSIGSLSSKCILVVAIAIIITIASPMYGFASETDGTVDTTNKYAWGENLGWLNLGTTGGNVHVTDAGLTGYIWSQNYGWINLNPAGSGVTNDGEGDLSGQAWGENLGYINFSAVSIDSSGEFSGVASGTVSGQVSFDCTNCTVQTDWRPASVRGGGGGSGGGSTGSGGGGGGGGSVNPPDSLGVWIQGNAPSVSSSTVLLQFTYDQSISEIAVSNFYDFHDAVRTPIVPTKQWNLCSENGIVKSNCPEGVYTVYVRFYGAGGLVYGPYTDSIFYGIPPTTPPFVPPPTKPGTVPPQQTSGLSSLLGSIGRILENFLPGFLRPREAPVIVQQPPAIPLETPLAFQDRWTLLPEPAIREFVFAPLPSDFALLLKKFPELERIARDVGISRAADINKLYGITLSIPGVTGTSLQKSFQNLQTGPPQKLTDLRQIVLKLPGFTPGSLPDVKVSGGKLVLPPGIPVASLPVELKKNIPSEVVFARTGNEKFDLGIDVKLNSQGSLEQQINTVSGELLKLVVRPQYPAERVSGYLAFNSRGSRETSFERPRVSSMLGSIVNQSSNPDGAPTDGRFNILQSVATLVENLLGRATPLPNTEERFTLSEFQYTDPDEDGVYTATIQAPVVDGNYTVYTIITYKDPNIPTREIKLTAVVDPEGYVYEQLGGRETRIPGAVVSIYSLDNETDQYELWHADEYGQENPQTTDVRGTYAFLVPPGYYYLTVDAPGYDQYTSKPFEVAPGSSGVHTNIRVSTKYGWLKAMDWKTFLLVLVSLMLLYNFYKDRRRDANGGGAVPARAS